MSANRIIVCLALVLLAAWSVAGQAGASPTATGKSSSERVHEVPYRGHVGDGRQTPFTLTIGYRHGNPKTLIGIKTGPIKLDCAVGSESRRLRFRSPEEGGSPLGPKHLGGYFQITAEYIRSPNAGSVARRDRIRGLVGVRRAMGSLRIHTRSNAHGDCDSPILAWQAHHHPKSR
jgi:hypothetical protein